MARYLLVLLLALFLETGAEGAPHTEAIATPTGPEAVSCPSYVQRSSGLPTVDEWRTYPAVADVNGDGYVDIAATPRKARGPRVWLGGPGDWTEASRGLALPGQSCGVGVDLADVNGDGHLDLGVADHCYGLYLFLGNGEGRWRPGPQGKLNREAGNEDIAFGDLDGDGDQDIVAIGSAGEGIRVYLNDGTGRVTLLQQSGLPSTGFGKGIRLADLTGDGVLDIAATWTSLGADPMMPHPWNLLWKAVPKEDGTLFYEPMREGMPNNLQARLVDVGDVNEDGHLDVAASVLPWRAGSRLIRIFHGDGAGKWTESSRDLPEFEMEGGQQYSGLRLADLNGDGHLDLVALTWLGTGMQTWMGNGQGGWTACDSAATGLRHEAEHELRAWGVSVADANRDGKPDLIAAFGRIGEGRVELWIAQ